MGRRSRLPERKRWAYIRIVPIAHTWRVLDRVKVMWVGNRDHGHDGVGKVVDVVAHGGLPFSMVMAM